MAQTCTAGEFACHAIVQAHESLSHSDIRNAIESGRHVERDGRVGWLLKRGLANRVGPVGQGSAGPMPACNPLRRER